jgi:hypothetical protein
MSYISYETTLFSYELVSYRISYDARIDIPSYVPPVHYDYVRPSWSSKLFLGQHIVFSMYPNGGCECPHQELQNGAHLRGKGLYIYGGGWVGPN